jgi:glucuronate isomerase
MGRNGTLHHAEPNCIHWTHLELKTAFGVDKLLKPETAKGDISTNVKSSCVLLNFLPGIDEKI